ncbi:cellulose biosynthesis protein BcsQ [Angulomicrobium tetraedrale]|uniref:Cellulose biosynthesis protein BcsQ n=1 Tax=Ancylobacter tetraedralis TaxID=217068 RepID=A0A839Z8G5_9HYPH|nr:AAA family ATPase [Ancylobacter tetraedralis]MBB3769727.1 cellulose biosynthesis protein BcsQ [Ancylobacter tetraedralis]
MTHIQIAFFNHKGGVSKTTSVFHIGWKLANLGKKVVLVDCDPQCNLTGVILNYSNNDEYPYESKNEILNIRDGLSPAFEARPVPLSPVKLQAVTQCPGLYVLPGHVGLAEYESQLSIAHELSASLSVLQNIPGSLRWLIDISAKSIEADYVLVDMSPSLGALNQNLFTTSDAFIIPMAPDFFSAMALRSLSRVLPKWMTWAEKAGTQTALKEAAYPWPEKNPKYLGSIVQNYRIRSRDGKEAAPTRAYQKWFDSLLETKKDVLIPALNGANLLLSDEKYTESNSNINTFLIEVPDFNSLIAISQSLSKPVFELNREDIMNSGSVAQNQVKSANKFNKIYDTAATKIISMTK